MVFGRAQEAEALLGDFKIAGAGLQRGAGMRLAGMRLAGMIAHRFVRHGCVPKAASGTVQN